MSHNPAFCPSLLSLPFPFPFVTVYKKPIDKVLKPDFSSSYRRPTVRTFFRTAAVSQNAQGIEYVVIMDTIRAKTEYINSAACTMDDALVRDRISKLPWEILDNILGRLPIENAVATTILSRKWRDKWVDISKLVLDDYSSKQTDAIFISRVYHVLLSHRCKIDKFAITFSGSESHLSHNDIETWISFLRSHDIEELTFNFSSIRTLPPSLFSCKKLKRLCLTNSTLSFPACNVLAYVFCLRVLVSLHLTLHWQHTDEELEKMINRWDNLEKLVLANTGFRRLVIRAQSLRYVSLEGDFKSVYVQNCPYLEDASFKMTREAEGASPNLVQPPMWLSCSRRLVMTGNFLKFLAKRYDLFGVSIDCHILEVLELDTIHFNDLDEISVALSILRSSSNLNTLLIDGIGTYDGDNNIFAEALNQGISKLCFNKLCFVRITISRTYENPDWRFDPQRIKMKPEVEDMCFPEVIRLLLAGSPILEKMHVHYKYSETSDLWFMRKLLLCERASSQLKLTYKSTQEPTPQKRGDHLLKEIISFRI